MQRKLIAATALLGAGLLATTASAEFSRRYVSIVGSTTVSPYVKEVGDRVAKTKKIQVPLLQSTGTNGGIKLFCEGLTAESPDVVNATRPMKAKERDECRAHGVGDILELKIGYDGLVLAQSKDAPPIKLTRKEARLALAKWIADESGKPVLNPNKTWKDVNPALPATRIEVLGPPVTSGTYDTLSDLISDLECKGAPWVAPGKTEPTVDMLKKCRILREDGIYVPGRENDEGYVARLTASPSTVAVLDYTLLKEAAGKLRAIPIDGIEPSPENIAAKAYAASRPLFVYIKKDQIGSIPGLRDLIGEFASERAWGDKGYLKSLGLIPMLPEERATYLAEVKGLGISPSTAANVADAPTQSSAKKVKSGKAPAKSQAQNGSKAKNK